MHKDKLSWPRCPIRHALQCNGSVKNYHPQVYVEECKYSDVENRQCNMLSDDDDGCFEVQTGDKKIFVICLGVKKLIINEHDFAVRTSKKVEYILSKLYENKGRA